MYTEFDSWSQRQCLGTSPMFNLLCQTVSLQVIMTNLIQQFYVGINAGLIHDYDHVAYDVDRVRIWMYLCLEKVGNLGTRFPRNKLCGAKFFSSK